MRRYRTLLLCLPVFVWCSVTAQTAKTGAFVTMLGRDTIAVEQYFADAHGIHGTCVVRTPRTVMNRYDATLNPDGEVNHFHLTLQRVDGQVLGDRDYSYAGDSIHVTFKQDTITRTYAVAAPGNPVPFFTDLFAAWEYALNRALVPTGTREFGVLAGRRTLQYRIEGSAPGTVTLVNPDNDFGPLFATMDKSGDLTKFDMTATTDKFLARRVAQIDVEQLAKQFAAREESGKPMGVLSPRDTVKADVNGAHVLIDYGRPAVRGRKIFGGVVPWNEVWRTGANAATQLVIDKQLRFGTIVVPPGTYTLFTLPSQHAWHLIINKQHGQWGTVYNKSEDLARLQLNVSRLEKPVERFTFDIIPHGKGGQLSFRWADMQAAIPFTVEQ
jgi:hypothetical protein